MPDLIELLDETRPGLDAGLDLDVDRLVRRARRRTVAVRAGTGAGIAVVAVAAVVLAFVPTAPAAKPPEVLNQPSELAPVGTWTRVEDTPLGARRSAFVEVASDGRLVIFGGAASSGDGNANAWQNDGAVYDPATGEWESIPPLGDVAPPLAAGRFGAAGLAADRLVTLWSGRDGVAGAVYDLETQAWTEIAASPDIEQFPEATAWDGEVLTLLQTGRRDGLADAPRVARWEFSSRAWELGTPPPFDTRSSPAVAFNGRELLVWGGSTVTDQFERGRAVPGAALDGYLYDVAADAWRAVPNAPVPTGTLGNATWISSTQAAVLTHGAGGAPQRAVVYDTETGSWASLPGGVPGISRAEFRFGSWLGRGPAGGIDHLVAVDASRPRSYPLTPWSGPMAIYQPSDGHWGTAPDGGDGHVVDLGGTVAVTTSPAGNPGDDEFGVRVLIDGRWRMADAPFVNRLDAGITGGETRLYVFGGHAGRDIRLAGDLWVLDLSDALGQASG